MSIFKTKAIHCVVECEAKGWHIEEHEIRRENVILLGTTDYGFIYLNEKGNVYVDEFKYFIIKKEDL